MAEKKRKDIPEEMELTDEEAYLFLKTTDGRLTKVPESKVELWLKQQERIKQGEYKPNEELITKALEKMGYGRDK